MIRKSLVAVALLSVVLPTHAASNGNVAYVDMQKVLEESKLGKRIQEQLRKEFESRAKGVAQEETEIRKAQQEFERDKPLMSKDQIAKKEKEIKGKIEVYQKKVMPIQQELMKAQQEKGREIVGPARKAVNAVAKNKKLGMVLERGQSSLMYVDESLDITGDVIKQLDSSTK